jgi:predicted GNAT family acetyltransferase
VDVERIEDPGEFLDAAGSRLLRDEARHNLILGLAGTLRDEPSVYPEYRLWLVRDGGEVVGAALRTPPFNVVLAQPENDAALYALAGAIDDELPGVVGALPEAEIFAEAWSAKTGQKPRRTMASRIFSLARVRPVSGVAGSMRSAVEADRPLLYKWLRAFGEEALPEGEARGEVDAVVEHRLGAENAGLVLWEDGGPVSLAGYGGSTPNGIRVGPVYTPPELRGRGYASALVAEVSARLLAEGRSFCFLYTDLANPTSNRIYERIGYERVCDSAAIRFEAPST